MSRKNILIILFVQEFTLILASFIWLFFRNFNSITNNRGLEILNPFKAWNIDYKVILFGILGAVILLSTSLVITMSYEPMKKSISFIDKLILQKLKPIDFLFVAVLSGVGEELFFRGILQNEIGIFLTSLIFAFLHIPRKDFWVYGLWAMFAGLYLGNIYIYTGNLFLVMLVHTLNNLLALSLWHKLKYKFIEKTA